MCKSKYLVSFCGRKKGEGWTGVCTPVEHREQGMQWGREEEKKGDYLILKCLRYSKFFIKELLVALPQRQADGQ